MISLVLVLSALIIASRKDPGPLSFAFNTTNSPGVGEGWMGNGDGEGVMIPVVGEFGKSVAPGKKEGSELVMVGVEVSGTEGVDSSVAWIDSLHPIRKDVK